MAQKIIIIILVLFSSLNLYSQKDNRVSFNLDSIIKEGIIFKCPYIVTDMGGKRLIGNAKDSVELISKFLKKHSNWIFEFSNHTDERGDSRHNIALSEKFVLYVGNMLFNEYSISKEQLKLKGYGESILLIPTKKIAAAKSQNEKEYLHSLNRRYELKVLKKDSLNN